MNDSAMASRSATSADRGRMMANAVRALSMDAVEKANSGHPGMPMGMADVATVLFGDHLVFDPSDPTWADRDRFVLSAGHGSMLLYSLLHLTGYDVSLDDLKSFRQLGSKTAGHPEYGHCPGVETTTGPLGQGLATGVGMAIAERMLNARFGDDLVGHHTYVLVGDGCLMEGISHEAIDLAGHLRLNRLIVLWDDNHISIDGSTRLSTSVDQLRRFEASGWNTISVDGHDQEAVHKALTRAKQSDRPTLVACRTTIGFGAPNKQGTSGVHGSPLGAEELALAKEALGWPYGPFEVPDDIRADWAAIGDRGRAAHAAWQSRLDVAPQETREAFLCGQGLDVMPAAREALADLRRTFGEEGTKLASRQSSQKAIEALCTGQANLIGGSADLSGSNGTKISSHRSITSDDFSGDYVNYGIREHGMGAVMNGIALHRGFIPYGGTFLVFADYARPSIRLSALMGERVVYVMTHDSIGLGEDGPTHQPVEHLASLRAMPNVTVIRPADAVETVSAWEAALDNTEGPTVLVLSRQGLPPMPHPDFGTNWVSRGGYVMREPEGGRDVTVLSTGSEVAVALAAADALAESGVKAAVVSLPSFELFAKADADYRASVLGQVPRVAVEAAVRQSWGAFLRPTDRFIGMSSFGASAPAGELYEHFGITPAAVVTAAHEALAQS